MLNVNQFIKKRQVKLLMSVGVGLCVVAGLFITLANSGKPKKTKTLTEPPSTGIINETFTEKDTQSALLSEQHELMGIKKDLKKLHANITTIVNNQMQAMNRLDEKWEKKFEDKRSITTPTENKDLNIHHVSFQKIKKIIPNRLNPAHYVPSNTSVRAIVLGGADADASVYGQSKNNGVMLFKLLEPGTLPNGQHSKLQGCRVSANTFGDISSERAFATLYRLSCAHRGEPILDKEITGWVFYNGKVGIKGQPLMRDGKVMAWAGVSGALSGLAEAAQYAQSMQQFGSFGGSSVVPSSKIAPFALYGGASKSSEKLSEYYVKRAEQYHPVIQVGAGNIVTIVFKDGFYLEPDEVRHSEVKPNDLDHFNVPPEVLNHIEQGANP